MQRRTLVADVTSVLCISIGLMLSPFPASAAGSEARIGMPFTGGFANSLSDPATHPVYFAGGQWSTDLYAPEGTDVAINVVAASGPVVIKVEAAGPLNSCNGVSPGGYAKLGIFVSGTRIGQVLYEHLDDLQVSTTNPTIPNGTVLGKTHRWPYSDCYQVSTAAGIHTHIEVGSSSGTACYVGRPLGTTLTPTDTIGAVGGGYTTKRCPSPLAALAPTSTPGSPEGSFDLIQRRPGGFRVAGWARDPDTAAAINVQAFVDGAPGSVPPSGTLNASLYRGDVGDLAYDGLIEYNTPGAHDVNVWAVNYGAGDSINLGTKPITIDHGASGSLDTVRQEPGKIRVAGWALDWDTADPITLHVYVDNVHKGTLTANGSRPDIGNAFAGYGSDHGFSGTVDYGTAGTHSVCVWAINDGFAGDTGATQVQCKTLTINNDAVGSYDSLSRGPGGLRLGGWGLDRSLDGAASIHVYVDGVLKGALPANKPRPDVGKAYPGYGDDHGFDGVIPWTAGGVHQACAWVVGDSLGANTYLGCKSITVYNDPVGSYDTASGVAGGIRVGGWGIDPETDNPLQVHAYRDGVFAGAYTANASRSDVVSSTGPFPGFSANHGFNFVIPSSPGAHSVCLWLIGVSPGAPNQGLGCRSATAT